MSEVVPELLITLPEPPSTPPPDDGLVRCPTCKGTGRRDFERRGVLVVRTCGECSATGRVLPEVPVLDYCRNTWPCCRQVSDGPGARKG